MPFHEIACAKVNLTLSVLGRRSDGYHDIESLVTFADIGDQIAFHPGPHRRVTVRGPFATGIDGPNLLETTLSLLRELDPGLLLGAVELVKNLPVAAGLGGGSADAAALLRAVRAANPERAARIDWYALAARLGADVPVCLSGQPALIRGVGDQIERLQPGSRPPPLAAVLVNPRVPLPTARVFSALAARVSSPSPRTSRGEGRGEGQRQTPTPEQAAAPHPRVKPGAGSNPLPIEEWGEGTPAAGLNALLAYMGARGNDLEPPAISLLPVIADVKAALGAQSGCRLAAMSGSGPTWFGIFDDAESAACAASALEDAHPGWWVMPTRLGNSAQADISSRA
jgi:4-diphosphocytidyl-2-C-methyl-D-erythritol kinase